MYSNMQKDNRFRKIIVKNGIEMLYLIRVLILRKAQFLPWDHNIRYFDRESSQVSSCLVQLNSVHDAHTFTYSIFTIFYHAFVACHTRKSINHYDKLGNHSNPILQPLLEQQQRRRLKKLWPVDLIVGWRGFTHWRGPHHDTVSTGGRCLTQHKP
jgi:hypothetical protein